jgi:hypothetical protein
VDIERRNILRSVDFAIVAVTLAALGAGLATLLYITSSQAAIETDPHTRRYLFRLAWLSLAMLLLTVMIFTWVLLRYLAHRLGRAKRPPPTPYVDAWSLAGQRYKLKDHPQDLGDESEWEPDQKPPKEEGEKE